MPSLSADSSTRAQGATITLATLSALGLLAMTMAYWSWQWLGPLPAAHLPPAPPAAASPRSAAGLFGNAEPTVGASAAGVSELRLLGSVAARPGRAGYALLRNDRQHTLSVKEGDEVLPGTRLAQVTADHVVLERDGRREILAWPVKPAAADSATPGAAR